MLLSPDPDREYLGSRREEEEEEEEVVLMGLSIKLKLWDAV